MEKPKIQEGRKHKYSYFLTSKDEAKFKKIAEEAGITGDGWRGRYISELTKDRFIKIDENAINIFNMMGVDIRKALNGKKK